MPAVRIAPSKQRRLCLGPAHVGCATYAAALELRGTPAAGSGGAVAGFGTAEGLSTTEGRGTADGSSRGDRPAVVRHRPIPTTTPVLLERPRPALPVPATMQRGVGQLVLVALLAIAFIAIFFARLGSAPATTPSPSPSATAVTTASPSLTASPTPSLAGSPSPSASAVASPARTPRPSVRPSPSPSHPAAGGTYTVKSGDTLSGIAAKFGTTIKVLAQLNGLAPPYVIHPGQVATSPDRFRRAKRCAKVGLVHVGFARSVPEPSRRRAARLTNESPLSRNSLSRDVDEPKPGSMCRGTR